MIIFLIGLVAESLYSIPAFARKYSMTCKTCHESFPKLKDFGEEFAGNGFVLKDQQAPRYYMETGDPELSLLRDFQWGIRLEGYVTHNNSKSKQSDVASPYLVKLLSGGELTKDVAYYFYFFFSERGDVAGLEDAFIMFNDLFGTELDAYVGQFQISDPLFKRELRLTLDDYSIYKTNVGLSQIDLTYDRGIMLTYGLPTGTDLTFEVLNGNGIGKADVFRNFDNDEYKNLFGRISQDIIEPLRIGAFGFTGKEKMSLDVNKMNMFGVDGTISVAPFELNLQYVQRDDTNPFNLISPTKVKTKGAFAELVVMPNGDESKIYGVGLFNWVESEQQTLNTRTISGHIGYMLRRNFRFVGEYTYDMTNKYGKLAIGAIAAF
jgi:hypothetical protein